ncbi:hypothetical protein AcV5_005564 [Taiwanofungus camphoratus]|nr:hypothetical protein AcV5_005564 [Antrodia cinnamomea]KAI0948786.1 hypothetical protein AcV7_009440 [Antrodia cinnamomea]
MSGSSSPRNAPLESQVGGHPGVLTSEDGSLLFKPALPKEVAFYQTVSSDPTLVTLRPFVPIFYGTLKLQGKADAGTVIADPSSIQAVEEITEIEKESIVLENLSHMFQKPNLLDIKLGTVLYDEDATPEKRARMEKAAAETTSSETGIRITGFQVYDLATNRPVITPRSWGKSITPANLPDGFARFFPLASSLSESTLPSAPVLSKAEADAEASLATGTGLPQDLLLPILSAMHADITEIREVLAQIEMRMVGASLLIAYEADWDRARAGLRMLEELLDKDEEDEGGEEDEEDEGEDEEDEEDSSKRMCPPYVVKLIDFAHTRISPGEGPDKSVLYGLDTVLTLLDGRIEQIGGAV